MTTGANQPGWSGSIRIERRPVTKPLPPAALAISFIDCINRVDLAALHPHGEIFLRKDCRFAKDRLLERCARVATEPNE